MEFFCVENEFFEEFFVDVVVVFEDIFSGFIESMFVVGNLGDSGSLGDVVN